MTENPLENEIRARIAREGPMSFREFMALALYDPRHGYYAAGRAALGRGGDYFTSVSVGNLFGELLGRQFREMWMRLGGAGAFTVVEQGANDGAFAGDVMGWAREAAPDFCEALRYEIVEPFEPLRARQEARLAEFAPRVGWRAGLEEVPEFRGVHFSNELVDAFPVHLVRYGGGAWQERHLGQGLEWVDLPVKGERLAARLEEMPRIEGYTTEVSLEAPAWARQVAVRLRQGWALTIDYGYPRRRYYDPSRRAGTLQAYGGHRRQSDPRSDPGRIDLTAHVEFTSVAEAFRAAGLTLAGYTDQHHFLTGLAAAAFAERPPGPKQTRALQTLLHPEMLGTSFQVLAMAREVPEGEPLAGFRFAREAAAELGLEREPGGAG